MSGTTEITGNQLSNALRALNVNFIMGGKAEQDALHRRPVLLIAALAESDESRLRLSLIPLFLEHPEFSLHVKRAAKSLASKARLTLQCYYSAAVWLERKYKRKGLLPDRFSQQLGIEWVDDPEENLQILGRRHRDLSLAKVNWLGTYVHAAQVWWEGINQKKV